MRNIPSTNPRKKQVIDIIRKFLNEKVRVTNVKQSKEGTYITANVLRSLGNKQYHKLGEIVLQSAFGEIEDTEVTHWNNTTIYLTQGAK